MATTERPTSTAEAAEALASSRGGIMITGAGSKQGWGAHPEPPETVIDTTALTDVIAYHPGDLSLRVGAGIPLIELQGVLAEHDQWLALDPAEITRGATVGGLLAAGSAGPRRYRYGTLRDLAIGARLVLSDGSVIRSGSHVIKNVAGYALTPLLHGSLGSLALVSEIILRLHPRPAATASVLTRCSLRLACELSASVSASGVEPAALTWAGDDPDDGSAEFLFDGTAAAVAAAAERTAATLRGLGHAPAEIEQRDNADLQTGAWSGRQPPPAPADGRTVLRIGVRPSRLPEAAAAVRDSVAAETATATWYAELGTGALTVLLAGSPEAQARVIDASRRVATGLGGRLLLRDRPPAVAALADALGPPPAEAYLMGAVKRALDPDQRLARGRFAGWF